MDEDTGFMFGTWTELSEWQLQKGRDEGHLTHFYFSQKSKQVP